MEEVLVYGLKGGPGHRRRAGHCLSEGRGVRVYRVAAAEALRWGVEQCVSTLVLGP